jgi:hypothetical protein
MLVSQKGISLVLGFLLLKGVHGSEGSSVFLVIGFTASEDGISVVNSLKVVSFELSHFDSVAFSISLVLGEQSVLSVILGSVLSLMLLLLTVSEDGMFVLQGIQFAFVLLDGVSHFLVEVSDLVLVCVGKGSAISVPLVSLNSVVTGKFSNHIVELSDGSSVLSFFIGN